MNAQTKRKAREFATLLAEIEARLAPNKYADFCRNLLERVEQIAGTRDKETKRWTN
ncbi:MAG: hypothetical protein IJZ10_12580 [Thermoguttaceae bacterium]|nr:hypothetical protein [Thermoguttaceae bacterium]